MDERLIGVIKKLLPEGSNVVNIYKSDAGEIKVDISLPGNSGSMTCSLKKNHAGELYIE